MGCAKRLIRKILAILVLHRLTRHLAVMRPDMAVPGQQGSRRTNEPAGKPLRCKGFRVVDAGGKKWWRGGDSKPTGQCAQ